MAHVVCPSCFPDEVPGQFPTHPVTAFCGHQYTPTANWLPGDLKCPDCEALMECPACGLGFIQ